MAIIECLGIAFMMRLQYGHLIPLAGIALQALKVNGKVIGCFWRCPGAGTYFVC